MAITGRMHRALAMIAVLFLSGILLSALIGAPRQETSSQADGISGVSADTAVQPADRGSSVGAACSAHGTQSEAAPCVSVPGAECLTLDALDLFVVDAPNAPTMGSSFVIRLTKRVLARQKSGVTTCVRLGPGQ